MYPAGLGALPDGQPEHHAADVPLPHGHVLAGSGNNRIGGCGEALLAIAAHVTLGSIRLMPVTDDMDAPAERADATVCESALGC